jgi:MATE family multidrug resistance protein
MASVLSRNAVLDYCMILGKFGFPKMGIAGAGYATAIGTAIAALYGMYLVFSDRERREYGLTTGWKWNSELMQRFIRFGVPSGMQWALEGLAFSIFLIFIGRMVDGSAALSASSIVVTIMMLSILPAMGRGAGNLCARRPVFGGEKNPTRPNALFGPAGR